MADQTIFSFHSLADAVLGWHQVKDAFTGAITSLVTAQELQLSYRFYPHFHPYVDELIGKLIKDSVRGLQAVDTKYEEESDGTLAVLPYSTVVVIATDAQAVASGGKQIVLKGMRATLPDQTDVTFDGNKDATLPGTMVLAPKRGMQVRVGATDETILFGDKLRLKANTTVTLNNGSSVELAQNTELVLESCKPQPELFAAIFSKQQYDPSGLVAHPYPVKDLDFSTRGAYAGYNWELFYHVPLTIAIHLSKNQRFEEAMQWFHYVFDPTDDSDGPTPERFWKVRPFQYTDVRLIEEILINLSTGVDRQLQEDTSNSVDRWKDQPFRPHVVARYRHQAFMFKAVMAYLDNLIAWGDCLFRQDTGESINEATQLYALAANILGRRPQEVPQKGSVRPQTYASLRSKLNDFNNALSKLEAELAFDLAPLPTTTPDTGQARSLGSLGETLYFCVPRNDKLISYWDTVADRLFKIRNSLNIQGIFRQLPLFEPPIDPALLARAATAGLDVGAIVSGVNQPLPLVRFQFLVQKAAEICQEVKSLGSNLLSAIEKEDNEALSLLRARHERVILAMVEKVRYAQWQEAIKAREGLEESLEHAIQRYTYYERLLGEDEADIVAKLGEFDALDTDGLEKLKYRQSELQVEQRDIEVDIAQDLGASGGRLVSSYELQELDQLRQARIAQVNATANDILSSNMALIPEIGAQAQPLGVGAAIKFGGMFLSKMFSMMAMSDRASADRLTYEANKTAKIGSYARREQEWAFHSNQAAGEINQIRKQLRAAQIREASAEWEFKNHQQQMTHAEEIEQFLKGEETAIGDQRHKRVGTQAFYAWMKREVRALYSQVFQFAFDSAKKAERALQHELGDPGLSFLQFGYLAGKEGLLAGDKLYLDIKRMEMAYHDLNQREYELTRHVSLLQINPLALLQLRATGRCTVTLPEELFDIDCPGHYFRRIKTVAVSIPCITGPYTSINCTLTLLKSSIRKSALLGDEGYARSGNDDSRFSDYFGSLQSIVTSSSQNDSGLFETNLRDERYLPFEGSGAVSEWQLELPTDIRQFDYDTIGDVILHLRYTAREGGALLSSSAVAHVKTQIEAAQAAGSVRLFSVRHEFPTEWAVFKRVKIAGNVASAQLTLNLRAEHFPYWSRGILKAIKRIDAFAAGATKSITISATSNMANKEDLDKDSALGGLLVGKAPEDALPQPDTIFPLTLYFSDNTLDDLWLAFTWGEGA